MGSGQFENPCHAVNLGRRESEAEEHLGVNETVRRVEIRLGQWELGHSVHEPEPAIFLGQDHPLRVSVVPKVVSVRGLVVVHDVRKVSLLRRNPNNKAPQSWRNELRLRVALCASS